MTLSGVYVIPHGDEIVDNPSDGSITTRRQIEDVAATDRSDSIVIISPHGLRLRNRLSVINTENLLSDFRTAENHIFESYKTDRKLAESIVNNIRNMTEEIQFVTSSGELSSFTLDFGTSIPLFFFGGRNVVSMGQTRTSDRISLFRFGQDLAGLISEHDGNISVILSADQAHTHWSGGPYGYSPRAELYDRIVVEAINRSDFEPLMGMDESFIEDAKPDSYWNMLILSGILSATGKRLKVSSYYVEKYFGMLVAR